MMDKEVKIFFHFSTTKDLPCRQWKAVSWLHWKDSILLKENFSLVCIYVDNLTQSSGSSYFIDFTYSDDGMQ